MQRWMDFSDIGYPSFVAESAEVFEGTVEIQILLSAFRIVLLDLLEIN